MNLIKKFMKIGGFKSEKELEDYGEERFFNDFPEARQYAKGGSIEAYPQTATMDNFFSYGVPVPPTYHAQGGSAYPMAQTEAQFFVPYYSNVYNPYNKEYGGNIDEVYDQAIPYGNMGDSKSFLFMEEGGSSKMSMGVNNRTGQFLGLVQNTAAKAKNREIVKNAESSVNQQFNAGMLRYGGLPKAQAGQSYKDVKTYLEQNPLEEYEIQQIQNDPERLKSFLEEAYRKYYGIGDTDQVYINDPRYAELAKAYGLTLPEAKPSEPEAKPSADANKSQQGSNLFFIPRSAFDVRHNVLSGNNRFSGLSTGTLLDSYGLEGLRSQGMQTMYENVPSTKLGRFFRPSKRTYYFGDSPGIQTPQDQNAPDSSTPSISETPSIVNNRKRFRGIYHPENYRFPDRRTTRKNLEALPELGEPLESQFDPRGYNTEYSDFRNQIFQNRRRRIGNKLDDLYQKQADIKKLYGEDLSDRDSRKMSRLEKRYNKIAQKRDYLLYDEPTSPTKQSGGQFFQPGGPYTTIALPLPTEFNPMGTDSLRYFVGQANEKGIPYMMDSRPDLGIGYSDEDPYGYLDYGRVYEDTARVKDFIKPTPPKKSYGGYMYYTGGPYSNLKVNLATDLASADPDVVEEKQKSDLGKYIQGRKDNPLGQFYTDQMSKNLLTDLFNNQGFQQRRRGMNDPMMGYYSTVEDVQGTNPIKRGTFDVLNTDNFQAPYSRSDVRYDLAPRDFRFTRVGGSIKEGDIREMTPQEIAEFVAMGGEIEYL